MYPQVFADFDRVPGQIRRPQRSCPRPAFFYGLQIGEEIEVEIEPGKILFIKLVHVGEPDKPGQARR